VYIKPLPIGTNPPLDEDRMPIWRAYGGDDLQLTTRIAKRDGTPAQPSNSRVKFELAETRFSRTPLWTAEWNDGIEEVDPQDHPGLVRVQIPQSIENTLRRGGYSFSMTVSDLFGRETTTVMIGNLLIEYEPTSPQHDIPYRDQPNDELNS